MICLPRFRSAVVPVVGVLALGCLALGCDARPGSGDAGPGAGSSYVPYDGDPGDWEGGEAVASVPCGTGLVDIWSFGVQAGQSIVVVVDTVSEETTFDPTLSVLLEDPFSSGFEPEVVAEGDDEMECSFPPPSGGCPRVERSLDAGGIVYVVIGEKDVCVDAGGLYRMTAEVNGAPAPLTIEEDDSSLDSGGEGGEEEHR